MGIIKLLILLGVAYGGYMYYQRYQAVANVVTGISEGESSGSYDSMPTTSAGGIGQVGGLDSATSNMGMRMGMGGRKKKNPYVLKLLNAAAEGDLEDISRILEKTAPDVRDSQRRTPLMHAVWHGHKDICTKLLTAGANIKFQDRGGFNALDYAAGGGQIEMLQYLLSLTGTKDNKSYVSYARIMASVLTNHLPSMPQAGSKLAYINRLNPEDGSPIHNAASNGYVAMATRLVNLGANVNIKNHGKQTPLHWASWNNRSDMIRYLVSQGAKINATDTAGNTPLTMAVRNNGAEAVKALLTAGAKKNQRNIKGQTALMIAIDKDFKSLVPILQ